MTGEEAIRVLQTSNEYHHARGDMPHSAKSIEAFGMALEALKMSPTNGDMIMMLFPAADISLNDSCFEGVVNRYGFDEKWWNAPYRRRIQNEEYKSGSGYAADYHSRADGGREIKRGECEYEAGEIREG